MSKWSDWSQLWVVGGICLVVFIAGALIYQAAYDSAVEEHQAKRRKNGEENAERLDLQRSGKLPSVREPWESWDVDRSQGAKFASY